MKRSLTLSLLLWALAALGAGKNVVPATTNAPGSLGTAAKPWGGVYAGAGAFAGSLKLNGSPVLTNTGLRVFNVLDYGMTNDVARPISVALQALLPTVSAAHGTIFFPRGDYYMDQMVWVTNSYITFLGESGARIIAETNIAMNQGAMFFVVGTYIDFPYPAFYAPMGDNRIIAQTTLLPVPVGSLTITSSVPGAFTGWTAGQWLRVSEGTREPKGVGSPYTHGLEDAVLFHCIKGVTNDVITLDRKTECDLVGKLFGPMYYKGIAEQYWPTQAVARVSAIIDVHFKNLTVVEDIHNLFQFGWGGTFGVDLSIEDCVFDDVAPIDPAWPVGFYFGEGLRSSLKRCRFNKGAFGGAPQSQWFTMEDCVMPHASDAGSEYDEGCNHATLRNCTWGDNDGTMVGVLDFGNLSHYCTMEGCKFVNMKGGAIYFSGEHNTVINNIFDGIDMVGVGGGAYGSDSFAYRSHDLKLIGNTIRQNAGLPWEVLAVNYSYEMGSLTLIGNVIIGGEPTWTSHGWVKGYGVIDSRAVTASGNRFLSPTGTPWRDYSRIGSGVFNVTPMDSWSWATATHYAGEFGYTVRRSMDRGDLLTIFNRGENPSADLTNQFGLYVTAPGTVGTLADCYGYISTAQPSLLVVTNGECPKAYEYVTLFGGTTPIKVLDYWRGFTNKLILDYVNVSGVDQRGAVQYVAPVYHAVPFSDTVVAGLTLALQGATNVNNLQSNGVVFKNSPGPLALNGGYVNQAGDLGLTRAGGNSGYVYFGNAATHYLGFGASGAFTVQSTVGNTGYNSIQGGRSQIAAANEPYALSLLYGDSDGRYFLGSSHSATPDLIFSSNAGTERMRLTDAGDLSISGAITASLNGANVVAGTLSSNKFDAATAAQLALAGGGITLAQLQGATNVNNLQSNSVVLNNRDYWSAKRYVSIGGAENGVLDILGPGGSWPGMSFQQASGAWQSLVINNDDQVFQVNGTLPIRIHNEVRAVAGLTLLTNSQTLAVQGARLGTDGTNLNVVLRNSAGTITTNSLATLNSPANIAVGSLSSNKLDAPTAAQLAKAGTNTITGNFTNLQSGTYGYTEITGADWPMVDIVKSSSGNDSWLRFFSGTQQDGFIRDCGSSDPKRFWLGSSSADLYLSSPGVVQLYGGDGSTGDALSINGGQVRITNPGYVTAQRVTATNILYAGSITNNGTYTTPQVERAIGIGAVPSELPHATVEVTGEIYGSSVLVSSGAGGGNLGVYSVGYFRDAASLTPNMGPGVIVLCKNGIWTPSGALGLGQMLMMSIGSAPPATMPTAGASLSTDGTNLLVVLRNAAGTLTTNTVTLTPR